MKPTAKMSAEQLKIFRHAVPPSLTAKAANKILFDLLQNGKMKMLDAPMEETTFTEGDIIFRKGDPADACFLIKKGRVAVIVGDLDAPAAVMHREAGDIIGEMALLEEMPRSASIVALSDVTLLRIERDGFDQLIEADPVVTRKLLMMLSHRLRNAHSMNITNVEKRLQLLTQLSQLEEEHEILLEVQKARQEMVDLIVHDLRNPLANLYGTLKMLEMVLPAELLSDHQDLMSIAGLAYTRMKRLVDSLLDLRGMESGERELVLTAVDLRSLIQESVQLASFTIQKRQIDVCMRFPDKPPVVLVDVDMLSRVLANLIDNALKHLLEHGVLTIEVQSFDTYYQICVMDNGIGIEPEDRERVFLPYAQLADERKRGRGFGLGLAFVSRAVAAHNGRVWVESGDGGVGSKFVFTLPA